MPFREVDRVSEFNHPAQEVRARAEAFDNARDLLPTRTGTPEIISSGRFASGLSVFDNFDFGCGLWWLRLPTGASNLHIMLGAAIFVIRHAIGKNIPLGYVKQSHKNIRDLCSRTTHARLESK
jgi:hypothetical protein